MDTFEEFMKKKKQFEVIVSYDCSEPHKKFAGKLRDLLRDEYQSQEITLSNYRIGKLLTSDEVDGLKKEILDAFAESTPITEQKERKRRWFRLLSHLKINS